jgi:hypothetical protein
MVSVLVHIKALFKERDRRNEQRFKAMNRAIKAALRSLNLRLKGMNEFRSTLTDQAGEFVTKTEFYALKERMDKVEGRSGGLRDGWGWLIGIIGVALVLGNVAIQYFKH